MHVIFPNYKNTNWNKHSAFTNLIQNLRVMKYTNDTHSSLSANWLLSYDLPVIKD